MGADIFQYIVRSLEDNVATIEFYSGQSMGLAPYDHDDDDKGNKDGNHERVAAFWVSALACASKAFAFDPVVASRRAQCPLTQHPIFRRPTGRVVVKGIASMEDLQELLKHLADQKRANKEEPFASHGHGYHGPRGSYVLLKDADQGQQFIDLVDGMEWNSHIDKDGDDDEGEDTKHGRGRILQAYFHNVRYGPQSISRYDDYPNSAFCTFVQKVQLISVDYESIEDDKDWEKAGIDKNYWNTKATYRIVTTSATYLSHIEISERWCGT